MGRKTGSLALAIAAAALPAGCGEKTLDASELERELAKQLGAQAGQAPRSVACPDDVKAQRGKRFDCTLTAQNGDKVRVEVLLTNDEGGFRANVPQQQVR
jgi:hypothetical protein